MAIGPHQAHRATHAPARWAVIALLEVPVALRYHIQVVFNTPMQVY